MKIFISGATGKLGEVVYKTLIRTLSHTSLPNKKNFVLIPLVRKTENLQNEIITDFSKDSLTPILKDADVLIHLAGSVNTLDKKTLYESNVELTKKLIQSLPSSTRVIFASSISVYGKKLAENPANEETVCHPDSDYSRSKFEAEKIVRTIPNHVILRIGTIYGPTFSDYFKIFRLIEKGKMLKIGDGKNFIPFVHVEDIANAVFVSITQGKGTYLLANSECTQNEILDFAAESLGKNKITKQINFSVAKVLGQFYGFYCRMFHKRPFITLEHIEILGSNRQFNSEKASHELLFKCRNLRSGIMEMAESYNLYKSALKNS